MAPDGRNVYLITSCKGGVGKSTVAVNLAFALALCGETVLLADCDTKNRTADLMLGYDGVGMFDLSDVALGRVDAPEAILQDPRCERLYYCTVPPTGETLPPSDIADAASKCADAVNAGCLIMDTSGGIEFPLSVADDIAYEAVIVSTQSTPALRAAERTGAELAAHGVRRMRLIVNEFTADKDAATIDEMIDGARVPLLGIVPYDERMRRGQELGMPAAAVEDSTTPRAFYNIAMRTLGHEIPLLAGIRVKGVRKALPQTRRREADTM